MNILVTCDGSTEKTLVVTSHQVHVTHTRGTACRSHRPMREMNHWPPESRQAPRELRRQYQAPQREQRRFGSSREIVCMTEPLRRRQVPNWTAPETSLDIFVTGDSAIDSNITRAIVGTTRGSIEFRRTVRNGGRGGKRRHGCPYRPAAGEDTCWCNHSRAAGPCDLGATSSACRHP
jgi:hypothetical protein